MVDFDDFPESFTTLEVQAIAGVPGGGRRNKSESEENEAQRAWDCGEWGSSDSDDDIQIVLNDEDSQISLSQPSGDDVDDEDG
ncbi:hypothetical protein HPP92_016087 [Vanilla planifolia]|uniref:Uncharacterized protein n=1 Tax=Vanilla planifolia TaxID=51239 RepID=A0A835QJ24_VANPL|nr:hypothetical protein HPP92_016087 [Vanilla planifolia]